MENQDRSVEPESEDLASSRPEGEHAPTRPPTVAIVGRPNVGKSTLFNRLIGSRQAVVDDEPGVTRDRVYGQVDWNGVRFELIDTGGYVPDSSDRFEEAIRDQVEIAIAEADLILLTVDVMVGVTDLDESVGKMLQRTDRPVLVVANKADNEERRWQAHEFYSLGFEEVISVSSTNGTGTGDLLDRIAESVDATEGTPPEEDERDRIAIIGKPNVGKSSLVNALLREERAMVTEVSGTTRDSIDSVLQVGDREVVLVDTAGLRRRTRMEGNIEFYSSLRSERAIEQCDVAVLVVDAYEGLKNQDIRVLKRAEEEWKGMVLAINKWDLVDEPEAAEQYTEWIYERLKTLDYVPMVFCSAIRAERTDAVLDVALDVAEGRRRRIPTARLNELVNEAIEKHHPPSHDGARVTIKYATQADVAPPVFVFFSNHPKAIAESYRRYLGNQIRKEFAFEGVPIKLVFRKK